MNLQLRNVSKRYGQVAAVDDLSIEIEKGECVALLGPSGCGKTTTLNMVAGFLTPDSGSVAIDGADVTALPAYKRNVAMVFQNYALFPHMTVAKNVAYGLRIRHFGSDEIRSRVKKALELVSLDGMQDRYPRQLSGGQQQRVALARALIIEPSVLLLDEPLSNLDARLRASTRIELVQLLSRATVTALLVTHDQEEAMAMANRVAVMNSGRIEQIASPQELYSTPHSEFVARFLGEATILRGRFCEESSTAASLTIDGIKLIGRRLPDRSIYGEHALYVIRPEHVRLAENGPAPDHNAIDGLVRGRTFLGAHVRYEVMTRLGTIVANALTGTAAGSITLGSKVVANWEIGNAMLLPLENADPRLSASARTQSGMPR